MKKRLYSVVLLFSFFFCSGGFLVAHASEPYAPKYVTGSINFRNGENLNRTAGAASGSYYYHLPGFILSSSGDVYNDFLYYTANGSMNFSGSVPSSVTGMGVHLATNGTLVLYPGQIYAFKLAFRTNSTTITSSSFYSTFSGLKIVYRSSGTIVFYVDKDTPLNDLWFVQTWSALTPGTLSVYYCSLQALTGFTKDDSSADIIAAIENQTGELDQSITDAGQGVQDKIESQFDTSQGSEVGSAAQGFADQAAESLGVVSYVDTLFSGLSGLVTAGSTTLTFPAFAIAVQGTDYQVWQEHTFDLSQLDGWFSGLMAAVRLATSVVVVGAVIHYLQSVYKDVIG